MLEKLLSKSGDFSFGSPSGKKLAQNKRLWVDGFFCFQYLQRNLLRFAAIDPTSMFQGSTFWDSACGVVEFSRTKILQKLVN
jgi:hypothetical protein